MRSAIALALMASATPLTAQAQLSTTERWAYENLRNLEQAQRLNEIERQLSNMEIKRRSDEAMQSLRPLPSPPAPLNPYATTTTVVVVQSDEERNKQRDAELAASNARLRAISEAQKR